MTDDKQYAIREDYIDEMHNLDVLQASSAGRNDVGHSPPFVPDVNNGPRHHTKTQSGKPNSPCKDDLALPRSVSPNPPVRYEWEEWKE